MEMCCSKAPPFEHRVIPSAPGWGFASPMNIFRVQLFECALSDCAMLTLKVTSGLMHRQFLGGGGLHIEQYGTKLL